MQQFLKKVLSNKINVDDICTLTRQEESNVNIKNKCLEL